MVFNTTFNNIKLNVFCTNVSYFKKHLIYIICNYMYIVYTQI